MTTEPTWTLPHEQFCLLWAEAQSGQITASSVVPDQALAFLAVPEPLYEASDLGEGEE